MFVVFVLLCVVAVVLFVWIVFVWLLFVVVGTVCCIETTNPPQTKSGCCYWFGLFVFCVVYVCCLVCDFVSWGLCFGVGLFVVGVLHCSLCWVVLCCGVVFVVFVLLLFGWLLFGWLLLVVVGLGCCIEATNSPHKNKLVVVVGLICLSLVCLRVV